jgi:transposase-like protein
MHNFKENERELVKLVNFFSRRAQKLMNEGKLGPEHAEVSQACEHLITQLNNHALLREQVILRREELKAVVKDDPSCPKCNSNTHLKLVGTDVHEKGWKCNRYRCRRCNIEFTWNRPNNPWDMVSYMKELIKLMEMNLQSEMNEELKSNSELMLAQTQESLGKLQDIISTCDTEYEEMQTRDVEMDKMIKEFKRYLLIEKAKMEAEDN